jgi:type II secretory pathway component PulF
MGQGEERYHVAERDHPGDQGQDDLTMAQFNYIAKQGPEKMVEGIVEAESVEAASGKIIQLGYVPVDISRYQDKGKGLVIEGLALAQMSFPIRRDTVTAFFRQMADLVDAGVPLLEGLRIALKQTRHLEFRSVVESIHTVVRDGESFSGALARHEEVFSPLQINMVRAGEISGNMDSALLNLADLLERDQETRSQISASLVYPGVILAVAMVTLVTLFIFVIPQMMTIFEDMGESLPLLTRVVIGISDTLRGFWWLIAIAILGVAFYGQRLVATENGKLRISQIILDLPFLGPMVRAAETGRIARSLGTLMANGVMIVPALEAVIEFTDNVIFKNELKHTLDRVMNGSGLAEALRAGVVFPEEAMSMISVGEEAGRIQKGLQKLAEYYEKKTRRAVKMLTALIEPALILSLGLVVGFVFLAVLLPVLQVNLLIK